MKIKTFALAATFGVLAASASSAAVISAAGDGELFGTPPAVIDNGTPTDNDSIKAFDEIQDLLLTSDLVTDDATATAGSTVSSHMLFLNRVAGTNGRVGPYQATFTFSQMVLGVFAGGAGQDATDALLGASGTDYSGLQGLNNRGLESRDSYSISGNTITVNFRVTEPGDWLRVVTSDVAPVPLPAGAVLLPGALFALGAMRRRKAAKA